jgi:GR25 family glycosyltransferase involved in LPS biosynthesis
MLKPDYCEILVISLDADLQRREICISQLFGYNYKFVSAIDGRGKEKSNNSLVTAPVEAIWQSHGLALRQFLAGDFRYCLVLEDDFRIKDRRRFDDLVSQVLQEDFDLVQVGWLTTGLDIALLRTYEAVLYSLFRALNRISRSSRKLTKFLEKKLRPGRALQVPNFAIPDSFLPGAHAYFVSRNLAEMVLQLNNPTFLATDDFYVALSKMRSFNVFRTRRSFVQQQGKTSTGSDRFTRR